MAAKKKRKLTRHPWDTWFRRNSFSLRKGKHYQCMTHCMMIQLRAAAIKRGLRASVRQSDDALHVHISEG